MYADIKERKARKLKPVSRLKSITLSNKDSDLAIKMPNFYSGENGNFSKDVGFIACGGTSSWLSETNRRIFKAVEVYRNTSADTDFLSSNTFLASESYYVETEEYLTHIRTKFISPFSESLVVFSIDNINFLLRKFQKIGQISDTILSLAKLLYQRNSSFMNLFPSYHFINSVSNLVQEDRITWADINTLFLTHTTLFGNSEGFSDLVTSIHPYLPVFESHPYFYNDVCNNLIKTTSFMNRAKDFSMLSLCGPIPFVTPPKSIKIENPPQAFDISTAIESSPWTTFCVQGLIFLPQGTTHDICWIYKANTYGVTNEDFLSGCIFSEVIAFYTYAGFSTSEDVVSFSVSKNTDDEAQILFGDSKGNVRYEVLIDLLAMSLTSFSLCHSLSRDNIKTLEISP